VGKGHRGRTCAYCREPGISSTRDHVIPRRFLPEHLRANRPVVAACAACNRAKSADEHHLATVLPFGGDHAEASAMLEREVPRRLAKNERLRRELAASREPFELTENGVTKSTETIGVDPDVITRFARYMILGLHAYEWGVVPKEMWVTAFVPSSAGQLFQDAVMNMRGEEKCGDIGNGLFTYTAKRSQEPPFVSAWTLQIFGGVRLTGDPNDRGFISNSLFGLVMAKDMSDLLGD